ncbi:MAG: phosphonopyruvate hydrolase [Alphaproteobacteria bacterium]|nr:phosphonopyruvate hydrolase [Alphaproteobacteria bacterium]MBV9860805.1 phosphonopyruvate hydrolase [Alphaproteobacteria bacterium]
MPNPLRDRIASGLAVAMSAHNPLSARLAEEAGFDGIWASGFELSAAYGVPDASLLSFTQHLDMTRAMAERVGIPVIADLDTGYGNAINVAHVVGAYARAGAAVAVIEDKTFPKDTSLLAGGRQELVRIEEFQGKIAAAVDAGRERDVLVIARTEALIADLGLDEALRRGAAYAEAGAELLLVHSKRKTPDEIVAFAERWSGPIPLVLVPTAYPDLTEAKIRALGKIALVIYANHAIRAAVAAMRQAFAEIRAEGGIDTIESRIASVEDIFGLQRVADMKRAEKKYLR